MGTFLDQINVSTGPIARPLASSLAPLTHSLVPHCSLRSRAPLRSFARTTCSLTRSRAHGKQVFVYKTNASISYTFGPLCNDDAIEKMKKKAEERESWKDRKKETPC